LRSAHAARFMPPFLPHTTDNYRPLTRQQLTTLNLISQIGISTRRAFREIKIDALVGPHELTRSASAYTRWTGTPINCRETR
jgi:hypothetical protein